VSNAVEIAIGEARGLIRKPRLPMPIGELYEALEIRLDCNPKMRWPAYSVLEDKVAKYRPDVEVKRRQSLAHEAGHFLCDHLTRYGVSMTPHVYRPDRKPEPWEREANAFAEGYLMPLDLIDPWFQIPGAIRLSRIAEECMVPLDFAWRRLVGAGRKHLVWNDSATYLSSDPILLFAAEA
jgi:IrrE N-terminal-like domain